MNAQSSLRETLRSLPRPVWILFAGTFVNRFGSFVMPFLAIYLTSRGYRNSDAALALGAYGLGHVIASMLGGYLTDRIGRRDTIALSMFGSAISMMLLSQARELPVIVLFTGLTALFAEIYRPASSALLADLVPSRDRVTAFAAYRVAINAGWAFGPATAGFLAKHSFFWLFLGNAITAAAFGIIALIALPHGLRTGAREAGWKRALQQMRADRQFQILLAATFAISLVFLQMSSTFGLQITAQGLSPAVYGMLISLNGVLVVLFELPLTRYTRRLPAAPTIAVGFVLIGLGFALAGFVHTITGFLVVVVAFTLGEMISMPVNSAFIADNVPTDMRGRYMGVFGLVWALGLTFGPGLGLTALTHAPTALWLGCGALGIVAGGLMLRTGPGAAPRTAQRAIPTQVGTSRCDVPARVQRAE